jgi:hypothetical protein
MTLARTRHGLAAFGIAVAVTLLVAPSAHADRAFSARYAATERGQVTLAANTLETCVTAMAGCTAARNGSGTPADNGQFVMGYVDVDSESATFNSSTANLAMPSGATVLWAGLYWAADTSAGFFGSEAPAPTSRGQVRFTPPGSSSSTVTATTLDTDATATTRYQGIADVTSQVRSAGNGTYRVANVQAGTGLNRWAGWGLVVAYRDASQPLRRLHVYDGFSALQAGAATADVALGDFLTPASGTVRGRLGLLSWEGDRGLTGDGATLGSRALSDALNPAGDFFNSTVGRDGSSVSGRNPAYLNTMGLDADELSIDGALGNGVTSSTLHVATDSDLYLPGAIALATDEGPPISRTPPTVTGTARDGSTLMADRGAWDGTPTVTYAYQWRRCAANGTSCQNISGATASTYAAGPDDVGFTLRVLVTATNDAGSTSATSAQTAVVAATPPLNTGAPTVSGAARDGNTLTVDKGTWSGTPTITYAYQWRRCDGAGAGCVDIAGATGTTYTATSSDVGSTIRAVVTATNAGGSTSAATVQTATVAPAPPVNTAAPTISGTARDGSTLTADPGSWTGTPPLSYAYQWRRCNSDGSACNDIAGATGASYAVGAIDIGRTVRVRVTAANAAGSAAATSPSTGAVTAAPPVNTAPPTISGTPRDGETLTVSADGTWTGTQPIAFAYQWRRCNATGAACADIAGATASTYTLSPSDVGATLRARVIASNAGGSAGADSAPSAQVVAAPPVNTTPPTITGTARQGETVTAQPGTWSGTPPISYAYQWQRCDLSGNNCADIAGATSRSYTLTVADVTGRVRVRVTATNAGGSAGAVSAPASVSPAAPANSAPPAISGTARDGETLTSDDGTWGGTPPFAFERQWLRCDVSGASCVAISGATGATYTLTSADVGATIRVVVTATNAAGSGQSTSFPTGPVAGNAPANTTAPSISGAIRDGATLTADDGTWSGSTPLSYAHQWRRCNADGSGCADIDGATQPTYTLGATDVGHALRVVVTASNTAGATSAASPATEPASAARPAVVTAPTISGTARDGATLTADPGTWTGTPPIEYAYQWQRCDSDGTGCTSIAGATDATYTLTPTDVDHTVRVRVTATNGGGAATATSAQTSRVAAEPPANTTAPTVSGTPRDRSTLTADRGTWSGTPPLSYAYQWQRCDAPGEGCAEITGATDAAYELVSADVGSTVRVVVTASNAAGSTSYPSAATDVIAPAGPVNTLAPRVTGLARDGELLTATRGGWSGTPPITYAYQWRRCDATGDGCSDVAGATDATYRLTAADVDHTMRVVVTATNAAGSAAAASDGSDRVTAAPPQSTSRPTVSGTPRDGQTLTADHGTWSGTPPIAYAYQWQRCDRDGAGCADIAGAIDPTYRLTADDVEHTVLVAVAATNAGGSATATSEPTAAVGAEGPASTSAPTISGTPRDGRTLTADRGSWTGTPPITYAYQWRRCDADGAGCASIAGATGSTYDVSAADVDGTLRVAVTATNAGGSATATSAATDRIDALGPDNTAPPAISGTARDGETLTASQGEWTGTAPITYAFQWRRCDADGSGCADIESAAGATYTLTSDDARHSVRVAVTATNAGGSATATSTPTGVVAANPPVNATPPSISGAPRDGESLTADPGTWNGTTPIVYAYQWRRCDRAGANCVDIGGATSRTHALAGDDVDRTVRVVVTATNAAGEADATSEATALVEGNGPVNDSPPTIDGTAQRGSTLTATDGAWSGTRPISYAYQWQRCEAPGAPCLNVAGATGSTYALSGDDVDHTIRVVVTATNVAGQADATSAATARVKGEPSNDSPPTISGDARDGSTLTTAPGVWSGAQPISFSYRWERCDEQGESCSPIEDADDPSYHLTPEDVGHTIKVAVTAANGDGTATVSSSATPAVAAAAPSNTTPPTISGTARDGETLTADRGTWTGTPPITYAYQWQRCAADGSDCVDIDGATGETYTLTAPDAGHAVRVVVTASNEAGPVVATSGATSAVTTNPPENQAPPTITGTPRLGQTLTADPGEWSGTTPIQYAYQWQRCPASSLDCTAIPGATGETYTLTDDDVDARVRVVVTATHAQDSATATSTPAGPVTAAPAVLTPPSVSGAPREGETLTADRGTWSGSQPISYAYQWRRCDATGGGCVDVGGATGQTYTATASDVGHALTVAVTATNPDGSATAAASPTAPVTAASQPPPSTTPAPAGGAGGPPTGVDLATLPGSLLTDASCQTLATASRARSLQVAGVGRVRVRVVSGSVIVPDAPLQISVAASRGRTLKASATLDKRRVRLSGRNPRTATLKPSQLGRPGTRTLRVRVTPRRGRVRTAALALRFARCATGFTARQSRSASGTSLRLRVDSRAALSRVAFTVPARLALRGGRTKTAAGSLRIVAPNSAPRTVRLALPAGRRAGVLASSGTITVSFSSRGFTVTGLPTGTGIVQLTLAEPRSAARGGVLSLRAAVSSATGPSTLQVRVRGVRAR